MFYFLFFEFFTVVKCLTARSTRDRQICYGCCCVYGGTLGCSIFRSSWWLCNRSPESYHSEAEIPSWLRSTVHIKSTRSQGPERQQYTFYSFPSLYLPSRCTPPWCFLHGPVAMGRSIIACIAQEQHHSHGLRAFMLENLYSLSLDSEQLYLISSNIYMAIGHIDRRGAVVKFMACILFI